MAVRTESTQEKLAALVSGIEAYGGSVRSVAAGQARPGGSTYRHRIAGQVGLGDGGEDTVLFVADVNKLTLAVAAQRVNGGIDSISYDSVAAFHAGVCEHLAQDIGNSS